MKYICARSSVSFTSSEESSAVPIRVDMTIWALVFCRQLTPMDTSMVTMEATEIRMRTWEPVSRDTHSRTKSCPSRYCRPPPSITVTSTGDTALAVVRK